MKCDFDRIAFKVEPEIKHRFFMLCKGRRSTMTETLNQFVLRQLEAAEKKNTLKKPEAPKE